jgi:hypothetical protein
MTETFAEAYKRHASKCGYVIDSTVDQLLSLIRQELETATTVRVVARVQVSSPDVVKVLREKPVEYWYHALGFETEPGGPNETQGKDGIVVHFVTYLNTDGIWNMTTWAELEVDMI